MAAGKAIHSGDQRAHDAPCVQQFGRIITEVGAFRKTFGAFAASVTVIAGEAKQSLSDAEPRRNSRTAQ
jgi:hypothetical protein